MELYVLYMWCTVSLTWSSHQRVHIHIHTQNMRATTICWIFYYFCVVTMPNCLAFAIWTDFFMNYSKIAYSSYTVRRGQRCVCAAPKQNTKYPFASKIIAIHADVHQKKRANNFSANIFRTMMSEKPTKMYKLAAILFIHETLKKRHSAHQHTII